jgi:predicted amidohydrolase YtcJ
MKLITVVLLMSVFGISCTGNKVDKIYINAKIWTGDSSNPSASVMAIKGDKIVYVGDDASAYEANEVIDLEGKRLLPGFTDNHTHFLSAGYGLASVQLKDAMTRQEFIDRIKSFCKAHPDANWVMEGNWDHENWGGELPCKEWIDSVTGNHPLFISRYDGHMAFANSKAMELAGINASTVSPDGGVLVRNSKGEATGIFKDAAMALISRVIPDPTPVQLDQYFDAAAKHAVERGVTHVNDMNSYGGWNDLATYRRAAGTYRMILRMYSFVPLATWERLDSFVQKNGRGDDMLKWGGLKGYVDGSLGSTTAWFHQPYLDDPHSHGLNITDTNLLRKWVTGADKAGLHVAVHAIGDRANDFILSVYGDAAKLNGPRDRRFRVEHAQHVSREAIGNFAKQGVVASMHPYHMYDDGIWAYKRLDTNRLKGTYAFRSMIDKGVHLSFGSDWPVAPVNPMYGVFSAVTRITGDGKNPGGWFPAEKISVEDAVRAYTAGNAYGSFLEGKIGILKSGAYADFTVFEEDIFNIAKEKIKEVRVLRTIVGGKQVFMRVD